MPSNILDYDAGADAYDLGEAFDPHQSQDWQDGYLDAANDDGDFNA